MTKPPKVAILAGGFGTRLSEETAVRPKPLVKIGGYPILWHIMKIYAHYGCRDFVVVGGYKVEAIREYFLHYRFLQSDFTIDLSSGQIDVVIGFLYVVILGFIGGLIGALVAVSGVVRATDCEFNAVRRGGLFSVNADLYTRPGEEEDVVRGLDLVSGVAVRTAGQAVDVEDGGVLETGRERGSFEERHDQRGETRRTERLAEVRQAAGRDIHGVQISQGIDQCQSHAGR